MQDQNPRGKLDDGVKQTLDDIVIELKRLRLEKGMGLRDVSKVTGFSISTLSNYENFVRSPDIYRLALWSQVLGMKFKINIEKGKMTWIY